MSRYLRKKSWRFLLVELIVVFIGIYGAFYLTTLREQEIEERNQVNYYKTFLLNLDGLLLQTKEVKIEVDSLLQEANNNPDFLVAVNRNIDFTNNLLIVKSGFEAENFTTIGKDYLASLDRGSNLISIIEKRANYLETTTRDFLIFENANEEEFRKWYIEELMELSGYLERLVLTITKGAIPETQNIIKLMEG